MSQGSLGLCGDHRHLRETKRRKKMKKKNHRSDRTAKARRSYFFRKSWKKNVITNHPEERNLNDVP